MKEIKKYVLCFYLAIAYHGYAQIININSSVDPESSFSLQKLVEDVLINSDCAVIDNFSERVFGQPTDIQTKSYGYFKRPSGSDFPFEDGVVLTTGQAFAAGNFRNDDNPFPDFDNMGSGDFDLESALGISGTNDATFVKFNFVPTSDEFNFRFLMASEEYDGETECQFADGFAFLLRLAGTTTYRNLAVLPNQGPISVTNINNSAICLANPEFFEGYNLGSTNYGGRTIVLTANADVIPNETYEIKIVVADQGDFAFDSAIFLEAGSFNLGLDFGEDLTLASGNAACSSAPLVLNTEIPTSVASHKWFFNGVEILGETDSIFNVTQDGTYSVEVVYTSNCISTDSIVVEFTASPTASIIEDQLICDDNADGLWTLDFTSFNTTILGPQAAGDFTMSYHLSQTDADNNSNPLPNPYTNQIAFQDEQIFARIESGVNGNCYDTTDFFIRIIEFPITSNIIYQECDNPDDGDDRNGFVQFDLNSIGAQVLGSYDATQFNITYHFNQLEADMEVDPLPLLYTNTIANAQNIVVRLENAENENCYSTSTVSLIVNPLPELQMATLVQCDEDGVPDGFTSYNLNEANENIIVGGSTSDFTFTHYTSRADAENDINSLEPFPFTNIVNPQTIYMRVVNNTTGCVRIGAVELETTATDIGSADLEACDDDTDGFTTFNLSEADAFILQSLTTGLTLAYYASVNDAQLEINPLPNSYQNTTPFIQIIYVRVENSNACYGINTLTLRVNPIPEFDLEDRYVLCINTNGTEVFSTALLDTGLSTTTYNFEWRYNGIVIASETGSSLEPTQAGTYSVSVTDISTLVQTRCTKMDMAEVVVSEPPMVTAEVSTQLFGESNVIEAVATGIGDYEYSLDDGPWQESGVFTDVSPGLRLVTVRDKMGCGLVAIDVQVIDYPLYFTPNGDGNNDTWNIGGIGSDAKIYIFDRYGKLLKQLSPTGQGWNGTFNGSMMPTNDYWFTVVYTEPITGNKKEFKAHFTLKR